LTSALNKKKIQISIVEHITKIISSDQLCKAGETSPRELIVLLQPAGYQASHEIGVPDKDAGLDRGLKDYKLEAQRHDHIWRY
jgi:hypothetical protein